VAKTRQIRNRYATIGVTFLTFA